MQLPKLLFSFRVFASILVIGVLMLYTVFLTVFSDNKVSFDAKSVFDIKPKFSAKFSTHLSDRKDGLLDDILNATVQPDVGRSIFFLITKSTGNGVVALSTMYSTRSFQFNVFGTLK